MFEENGATWMAQHHAEVLYKLRELSQKFYNVRDCRDSGRGGTLYDMKSSGVIYRYVLGVDAQGRRFHASLSAAKS